MNYYSYMELRKKAMETRKDEDIAELAEWIDDVIANESSRESTIERIKEHVRDNTCIFYAVGPEQVTVSEDKGIFHIEVRRDIPICEIEINLCERRTKVEETGHD